ncbi:MAG: hypothetical protein JSS73_13545 [Bacteroidetes bacterium]|nr:hypothetical protein [Bacteroidota bacterium]
MKKINTLHILSAIILFCCHASDNLNSQIDLKKFSVASQSTYSTANVTLKDMKGEGMAVILNSEKTDKPYKMYYLQTKEAIEFQPYSGKAELVDLQHGVLVKPIGENKLYFLCLSGGAGESVYANVTKSFHGHPMDVLRGYGIGTKENDNEGEYTYIVPESLRGLKNLDEFKAAFKKMNVENKSTQRLAENKCSASCKNGSCSASGSSVSCMCLSDGTPSCSSYN